MSYLMCMCHVHTLKCLIGIVKIRAWKFISILSGFLPAFQHQQSIPVPWKCAYPLTEDSNVHEEHTLLCPACDLYAVTLTYLGVTLIPTYWNQTKKKLVEIIHNPDFKNKCFLNKKNKQVNYPLKRYCNSDHLTTVGKAKILILALLSSSTLSLLGAM